ncbi:unnamed protein product, partial [Amoebophrya sp. A25]|eukprot:GSA25T00005245001.1
MLSQWQGASSASESAGVEKEVSTGSPSLLSGFASTQLSKAGILRRLLPLNALRTAGHNMLALNTSASPSAAGGACKNDSITSDSPSLSQAVKGTIPGRIFNLNLVNKPAVVEKEQEEQQSPASTLVPGSSRTAEPSRVDVPTRLLTPRGQVTLSVPKVRLSTDVLDIMSPASKISSRLQSPPGGSGGKTFLGGSLALAPLLAGQNTSREVDLVFQRSTDKGCTASKDVGGSHAAAHATSTSLGSPSLASSIFSSSMPQQFRMSSSAAQDAITSTSSSGMPGWRTNSPLRRSSVSGCSSKMSTQSTAVPGKLVVHPSSMQLPGAAVTHVIVENIGSSPGGRTSAGGKKLDNVSNNAAGSLKQISEESPSTLGAHLGVDSASKPSEQSGNALLVVEDVTPSTTTSVSSASWAHRESTTFRAYQPPQDNAMLFFGSPKASAATSKATSFVEVMRPHPSSCNLSVKMQHGSDVPVHDASGALIQSSSIPVLAHTTSSFVVDIDPRPKDDAEYWRNSIAEFNEVLRRREERSKTIESAVSTRQHSKHDENERHNYVFIASASSD